jgi:phosphoribosylamine--glycine ligase
MRWAVLGSGGREAAISWKLSQSAGVEKVFVFPGNPGMPLLDIKISCLELNGIENLVAQLQSLSVEAVVIGPEKYLQLDYATILRDKGFLCIGPDQAASQLESSKYFCKQILVEAGLPTASFEYFEDEQKLKNYCEQEILRRPLVLKADFLAQGKGVFVCHDLASVQAAITDLSELATQQNEKFAVLVEECLEGQEFSAFALCNGDDFFFLGTACDYKRLNESPTSPNTGGMGAYSPCDFLNEKEILWLQDEVFAKTLDVMENRNTPFQGFLFAGCMKTSKGIYLLEYNVRLGDPETQVLLPRLNEDFSQLLLACATNNFSYALLNWKKEFAVHVVKADASYPQIQKNKVAIHFKPEILKMPNVNLFFSGVERSAAGLLSNGGRILGVTALQESKAQARSQVYEALSYISFSGEQWRKDIANEK